MYSKEEIKEKHKYKPKLDESIRVDQLIHQNRNQIIIEQMTCEAIIMEKSAHFIEIVNNYVNDENIINGAKKEFFESYCSLIYGKKKNGERIIITCQYAIVDAVVIKLFEILATSPDSIIIFLSFKILRKFIHAYRWFYNDNILNLIPSVIFSKINDPNKDIQYHALNFVSKMAIFSPYQTVSPILIEVFKNTFNLINMYLPNKTNVHYKKNPIIFINRIITTNNYNDENFPIIDVLTQHYHYILECENLLLPEISDIDYNDDIEFENRMNHNYRVFGFITDALYLFVFLLKTQNKGLVDFIASLDLILHVKKYIYISREECREISLFFIFYWGINQKEFPPNYFHDDELCRILTFSLSNFNTVVRKESATIISNILGNDNVLIEIFFNHNLEQKVFSLIKGKPNMEFQLLMKYIRLLKIIVDIYPASLLFRFDIPEFVEICLDYLCHDNSELSCTILNMFCSVYNHLLKIGQEVYFTSAFNINGMKTLMDCKENSDDDDVNKCIDAFINIYNESIPK